MFSTHISCTSYCSQMLRTVPLMARVLKEASERQNPHTNCNYACNGLPYYSNCRARSNSRSPALRSNNSDGCHAKFSWRSCPAQIFSTKSEQLDAENLILFINYWIGGHVTNSDSKRVPFLFLALQHDSGNDGAKSFWGANKWIFGQENPQNYGPQTFLTLNI
jgi:hypothetical protein